MYIYTFRDFELDEYGATYPGLWVVLAKNEKEVEELIIEK